MNKKNKTSIESDTLNLFKELPQIKSELDIESIEKIIKDIDINSALNKISRAVAGREYTIETDNEKLKNKLEEIQLLFKNIKFNRIFNFMLKARLYGFSCFEIIYNENYEIDSLIPIPHKNVSYNDKEKKWELKIGDKVIEITYDKFLLCIHEWTPSKITGQSILESCNASFLDKELFKNQLRGISKKYGDVIVMFPFEAGEDEKETRQRAEAIKEAKGGNVIGIPIENFGGSNGSNLKDNLQLIKLSDLDPEIYTKLEKIEKVKIMQNILGSTLTMDAGEKGTQALGTIHMDAETQVVEECCSFISDSLGNLFKSLMVIKGEDYSEFYFKLSPPNNINIQLEIEKKEEEVKSFKLDNFLKLKETGYKANLDFISESLGIDKKYLVEELNSIEFSKKKNLNDLLESERAFKINILKKAEEAFMKKFQNSLYEQTKKYITELDENNIKPINFNFDDFEEHSFIVQLISEIGIEKTIEFESEINPFKIKFSEAISYAMSKKPVLFNSIDSKQEKLKDNVFWIKKSTDIKATEKVLSSLQKSVETGGTFKEWKKDIENVADKAGLGNEGWYSANIYRTNMSTFYSVGEYEKNMENKANKPYWFYDGIQDNRQSSTCQQLDGKIYKSDDPIWSSIYPPNHFMCRSKVTALDNEDLKDYDLKVSKPSAAIKKLDLGDFKGNPAKGYWENLKKNVKIKETRLTEKINVTNFNFKNLDVEMKKLYVDTFKESPDDVKKIVSKTSDRVKTVSAKGDYYITKSDTIYYSLNGKNTSTISHEFGHFIDCNVSRKIKNSSSSFFSESNAKEIGDFSSQILEWQKNFKGKKGTIYRKEVAQKMMDTFGKEKLVKVEYGAIQDIFESMTKAKVQLYRGHGATYWKQTGNIEVETFANMFSLKALENTIEAKEQIEFIRTQFPNFMEVFEDLLKHVAEVL
ncbi:MAG: phage portal protein family protein [Fusobacteriaceae bacterium]